MASLTSTQIYTRARILFVSALLADVAAFGIILTRKTGLLYWVLALLIASAVLFVASVLVRRAGDAKLRRQERS